MRIPTRSVALAALTLAMLSCSDNEGLGPPVSTAPQLSSGAEGLASITALPPVRISEIHYDSTGTDAGERIEVSAPVGTSLSGWSIVLYNGNGGAAYDTDALMGLTPTDHKKTASAS